VSVPGFSYDTDISDNLIWVKVHYQFKHRLTSCRLIRNYHGPKWAPIIDIQTHLFNSKHSISSLHAISLILKWLLNWNEKRNNHRKVSMMFSVRIFLALIYKSHKNQDFNKLLTPLFRAESLVQQTGLPQIVGLESNGITTEKVMLEKVIFTPTKICKLSDILIISRVGWAHPPSNSSKMIALKQEVHKIVIIST